MTGVSQQDEISKLSCRKIFWITIFSIIVVLTFFGSLMANLVADSMNEEKGATNKIVEGVLIDDVKLDEETLSKIRTKLQTKEHREKYLHALRIKYQEKAKIQDKRSAKDREKRQKKAKKQKKERMKQKEQAKADKMKKAAGILKKRQSKNNNGTMAEKPHWPQGGLDFLKGMGRKENFGNTAKGKALKKEDLVAMVKPEDYTSGGWSLVKVVKSLDKKNGLRNVVFRMCRVAFGAHSRDPVHLPFFEDLYRASDCDKPENKWELSYEDAKIFLMDAPVVAPSGFVHHEARCGSTLVANVLATDPENLVYSEAQPFTTPTLACPSCEIKDRVEFIQMAVSLMGVSTFHKGLFFKLVPTQVLRIELLKQAFPDTPYIYLHREPVAVMMSQLRIQKSKANNKVSPFMDEADKRNPNFLDFMQNWNKPPCLRPLKEVNDYLGLSRDGKSVATEEEYCAAHLYIICKNAADALQEDQNGLGVHYTEDLVERFVKDILPKHFGVNLDPAKTEKALLISQSYSKSRSEHDGYNDDAEAKREKAWDDLKQMAEKYVSKIYERLLELEENSKARYQLR